MRQQGIFGVSTDYVLTCYFDVLAGYLVIRKRDISMYQQITAFLFIMWRSLFPQKNKLQSMIKHIAVGPATLPYVN